MDSDPVEAAKLQAAVKDLADAPKAEKKALAVDHKMVVTEVQLLLAEKRTSFALLRTGVSVSLVPLSIWTVLLATSKMWNVWDTLWLLVPVMTVAVVLFALGVYLVVHALHHLAHTEKVMHGLRQSDTLLEDLLISHGRASRILRPWAWGVNRRGRPGSRG